MLTNKVEAYISKKLLCSFSIFTYIMNSIELYDESKDQFYWYHFFGVSFINFF